MNGWLYETVLGHLCVVCTADAVVRLSFSDALPADCPPRRTAQTDAAFAQISEYLSGARTRFTLPLAPQGTPFQRRVWDAILQIPYAQTKGYAALAADIGSPNAARAVGAACRANPIWILVPCHRVVGKNGALTGYAGGLDVKRRLLELERRTKKE